MADTLSTKVVTDATFDAELLKSDKPVLVDFWAPWCGPCLQVAPVLAEIGAEHQELTVVKINIDENPKIASLYGPVASRSPSASSQKPSGPACVCVAATTR